ncbi:MAG TPA: hypothetical protein VI935_05495 [Thermodesulfobacteriota bacterium]|nr:hypothetical protein [Thermodesulfobacteriota bacterium]
MLCADDATDKASDRETNLLGNGVGAFIWLNSPPPGDTSLYCEVTAQGDSKTDLVATYTLTFTHCLTGNTNYWWAAFTTPVPSGDPGVYVYTMECYTEVNGDNIGKDTWRQILE